MVKETVLRGMAWNHLRGMGPALAVSEAFRCQQPATMVLWDTRPLGDFEAYPIEQLARQYDLILFDHPFTGDAAAGPWLLPLDEWIEAPVLDDLSAQAVGQSFQSYRWAGHQWGLPVDAAAQVMVSGAEPAHGEADWKALWRWAQNPLGGAPPLNFALPGSPVHLYSLWLAICQRLAGEDLWTSLGLRSDIAVPALEILERLWQAAFEGARSWDPITLLPWLGEQQGFSPWVFGYVTYSRPGYSAHPVRFARIPTTKDNPGVGSVLGGVGIGVSSLSKNRAQAVAFAKYFASPAVQSTVVLRAGGQPAVREVWENPDLGGPFFHDTLPTVRQALLRPRARGYPAFQAQAAQVVHQGVTSGRSGKGVVEACNRWYRQQVGEAEDV